MYTRKFIFSAFSLPTMVYMHHASGFQQRRSADKDAEAQRR